MASPQGRPPDPTSDTNTNRDQIERTGPSRYTIPAWRFKGNSYIGLTVGKTRKPQILATAEDGNRVHITRSHMEKSNRGQKLSASASIGGYNIPTRRYRGNTVTEKNGKKTENPQPSDKIEGGNPAHSESSQVEVNAHHGSEFPPPPVITEGERSPRENISSILQKINQNL